MNYVKGNLLYKAMTLQIKLVRWCTKPNRIPAKCSDVQLELVGFHLVLKSSLIGENSLS